MLNNLLELQSVLMNNNILISFSGKFSQGIIEELGEAIKRHMESEDKPQNKVFNVFGIFVEQTQNIKNYMMRKEGSSNYNKISSSGIVSIGETDSGYFIWSGNLVENSDLAKLIDKLDKIKAMNKDELKKYYKEQLKRELPEGSLSAGVGLIDIARKAAMPIYYSVEPRTDNLSFFQIKVTV
jgi:hypothetical protein